MPGRTWERCRSRRAREVITEQRPGSATAVAQRFGAAGHTLTYCHAPDGEAACVGLSKGGRCPLADVDVSVVVDARADAADMTDSEFGVICAIRHGTPVVWPDLCRIPTCRRGGEPKAAPTQGMSLRPAGEPRPQGA